MKVRVFKFGGSSFPTLASYHEVARYLLTRLHSDAERLANR